MQTEINAKKRRRKDVPTHGVPHVDVAPPSPVVGLREWLPIWKHVAPLNVGALSEAVVVHPGRPVVDIAGVQLSVGWTNMGRREGDIVTLGVWLCRSFCFLLA